MKSSILPTALIILDGFGIGKKDSYNAIYQANTPFLNKLYTHYPHTQLLASGNAVGLPEGVMGNSQAGHMSLGAGRIVKQGMLYIDQEIDSGNFFLHKQLRSCLLQLQQTEKSLHIFGLVSNAAVHSSIKHLFAYLSLAERYTIGSIFVHAFLDGRDTSAQSAQTYLTELSTFIRNKPSILLASITGRFYAMDRDNNWDRIEPVYSMLTTEQPVQFFSWKEAIQYYYNNHITDEFIPPTSLAKNHTIKPGDGIIFFNVRPDRARELTDAFTDPTFNFFPTKKIPLSFFITPYAYDTKGHTTALFTIPPVTETLKEILSNHNKTVFVIAETEKYAAVTYFFAGGQEIVFPHETQLLIDSIPKKQYIDYPQMSAPEITTAVMTSLEKNPCDFYLINYANADMVGHSGNLFATIRAIEILDKQLEILYKQIVQNMQGTIYITADHGKAEEMYDTTKKETRTSHTTNPVPFIMINKQYKDQPYQFSLSSLADVAPFILTHMNITPPSAMTGSRKH